MVQVYIADITNLPDPKEFPESMEILTTARREKVLRYAYEDKRKQGLGAGLLLHYVLKKYGASVEHIQVGVHGKPEIDGIHFNLSHAGNIVVCAISDQPVGCDVEKIAKELHNIARRFFCKSENEYLANFQGEERKREFFRIWTMKESYMKMTGEGMLLALDRMEFIFGENIKVYRDGQLCTCSIKEYEIPEYRLTVCAEDSEFAEELLWVDLRKLRCWHCNG